MTFYLALALVNIACFLPMYLMNIREQANPIAFLTDEGLFSKATLRHLYARKRYTDPFRINFDFTFLILIAGFFQNTPQWLLIIVSLTLSFGFVEILYSSIMHLVFRRAPSLTSDISLLKTGWSVAHNHRYLFLLATAIAVVFVFLLAVLIAQYLHSVAPSRSPIVLALAAILVVPGLYNWRSFLYSEFIWRVAYSPILHLYRNLSFSKRTHGLLQKDGAFFENLNEFKAIALKDRPNIIIVCIESYGSIVFRDPAMHAGIADSCRQAEQQLQAGGYTVASNYSEAPIFAGGSWLSYTSLTYGTLLDDAYVYDGLFSGSSSFSSYESLFHILERNGYSNNLLCPLGGVASRYVNWDGIDRCFRPQRKFDFDSLNYEGTRHSFFVPNDMYAAPDQYSLNYAYRSIDTNEDAPFSLFFCTLNSHYPWATTLEVADDWRQLNEKIKQPADRNNKSDARTQYIRSIRYQLEYLVRFLLDNADDDLLLIAFGDHQPPMITPESMGKHTPIHVISRRPEIARAFLDNGFVADMDLADAQVESIKHQGFLSLLMGAINVACGTDPRIEVVYRKDGIKLLDDT